ncbi:MAG: S53 family peptidase [Acidobacteriaceae bacterium]
MNNRKLILSAISSSLLLACQFGWSQSATSVQVKARVALAQQTGKPLPLVPANAVPAGHYRPHIMVLSAMASQLPSLNAQFKPNLTLPSFCNKPRTGNGFQFCPNAMQAAYGVPFKKTPAGTISYDGTGMTIGIVDAYHYANASSDLDHFNAEMGLPACTAASGCFKQLDQNGGTNYCGANANWELETMLDLEWAHSIAPGAKIVLVEGCSNSFADLGAAVTTAVSLTDVVSNSYGAGEFSGENTYDSTYNVNKPILFSSGDNGTPTSYPCASPYATCVGGTSLRVNPTTFQRTLETGWSGSGGGCSSQEAQPGYQSANGVNGCGVFRATPDVAADADPNTGAIVYDSGNGGHYLVGGTSLASPVTAALYADVMQARHPFGQMNPSLYTAGCHGVADCTGTGKINAYYYYDVLTGNNGLAAGPGYDQVTGMGVSNAAHLGGLFGLN